ncbi:hypothetical protein ABZY81_34405 [Streptomyces sp. NPDC006514]|uniref:hypothetical protein n=1 Tax=Streptomyces sp. NPDC006514 TaxID=3154308 RepID=UPI0033A927F3
MSGFARDTKCYGDRLVHEPLESKWRGYHAHHCGCGQDWVEAHAVPAGFTVIPRGRTGSYGPVGPGLTEGVDEETLTANALREAVTGKPGAPTRYESVRVTSSMPPAAAARTPAPLLPRLEAANARIRRLTEENQQLREQLARALGEQRTVKSRTGPPRSGASNPILQGAELVGEPFLALQ